MGSRYYSAPSSFYGGSNSNSGGSNSYNSKQNYKKKSSNYRKFNKKEKAKGATIVEDSDSGTDSDNEDSDEDPYTDIEHDHNDIPQPIEDFDDLKTQFRRLYIKSKDDIKELIRRLSPQEKEERMRKGLCLYCGKPGHVIANCTLIRQKERGRAIKSQEDDDIWNYDDDPLNWNEIQPKEQC